ncbi:MAG: hypothetical protein ABW217_06225 [Polyangiaceae bacterium]
MKRAARSLLALIVGLAPLAASCSKERKEPANPGWLVQCTSDVDCAVGACLCGRCSVECDGDAGACSAGPPASACFARGSIAHEAFCGDGPAPAALCLATCASDDDCPDALTCAVGACVPAPRTSSADAGSDACASESCPGAQPAVDPRVFNEVSLLPPDFHWAPEVIDEESVYTDDGPANTVDFDVVCRAENPCPTLEQVLSDDACLEIVRGCDLIRVAASGSYMYWYTGYGTPPVAAVRKATGATFGRFGTTRELYCTTTEITMCSTCGEERPRCDDVPGGLPPPPP